MLLRRASLGKVPTSPHYKCHFRNGVTTTVTDTTGWPFTLFKTSRWHWFESCVLVWGLNTKAQLLFCCQREVGNNVMCHSVQFVLMNNFYCKSKAAFPKNYKLKNENVSQDHSILITQKSCTPCGVSNSPWRPLQHGNEKMRYGLVDGKVEAWREGVDSKHKTWTKV